jgi:hypothetical protein
MSRASLLTLDRPRFVEEADSAGGFGADEGRDRPDR